MIMQSVTALVLSATPAVSQSVTCFMENGAALNFTIDRNQFVDAVDPSDPPRRKVSMVTFGEKHFPAEPFLIGDTLGFQAEGLGGTTTVFVMQAGGTAVFTDTRAGLRVTGQCEAIN